MSTTEADAYVMSVINKYKSRTLTHSDNLTLVGLINNLREWAGQRLIGDIQFSGSRAKGTAIFTSSDVDLFIPLKPTLQKTSSAGPVLTLSRDLGLKKYPPSNTIPKKLPLSNLTQSNQAYLLENRLITQSLSPNNQSSNLKNRLTLPTMYDLLYKFLDDKNYKPRKQNVSIGIKCNGLSIDIVPARLQQGYSDYFSLYKSKTGSWTQTNIKKHIEHVKNSERTGEIIALKIWRKCNNLEFPSTYLELIVIEALKYKPKCQVADNILCVLQYLFENIESKRIVDMSNSNNIISDDLTSMEKRRIRDKASESLKQLYWGNIIW